MGHDLNVPGLFFSKAQVVTAQAKLDRIAHRSPANDFNGGSVTEAHLKKPSAQIRIATDRDDAAVADNAELVQAARFWCAAVVTGCKSTCLLHNKPLRALNEV